MFSWCSVSHHSSSLLSRSRRVSVIVGVCVSVCACQKKSKKKKRVFSEHFSCVKARFSRAYPKYAVCAGYLPLNTEVCWISAIFFTLKLAMQELDRIETYFGHHTCRMNKLIAGVIILNRPANHSFCFWLLTLNIPAQPASRKKWILESINRIPKQANASDLLDFKNRLGTYDNYRIYCF